MRPKDLLVLYSSAAGAGEPPEGGMMGRAELLIAHPWIGDGVADVGQEIAGEAEGAGDEGDGEDQFAVALGDGINQKIAHAVDAENSLDDDCAGDHGRKDMGGDGDE